MRIAFAVLISLSALAQNVETRSTLCQTTEVPNFAAIVERRLVGCGDGFPHNLLWHLDRSDSSSGDLDYRVTRKTTGRGAVIYVLDFGVMQAHDEFVRAAGSNVIAGIDAGGARANPCADPALAPCYYTQSATSALLYGHGTGVASVAAGKNTGVAPDASIVAVLIVAANATKWVDALKQVIRHAYDPQTPSFRTAIISASVGITESPEVEQLIARMTSGVDADGNADTAGKRFLFVVMAGNYNDDPMVDQCTRPDRGIAVYPARIAPTIDGLVSVGGIDRTNAYWSGSCRGPLVEVAAPAEDMFVASIMARDTYRYKPEFSTSGTSWATPYVAGIAARLLEMDPNLTPAQLEALLKGSPSRVDGVPVPVILESHPPQEGPRRRSVRH
jgi:serine protease